MIDHTRHKFLLGSRRLHINLVNFSNRNKWEVYSLMSFTNGLIRAILDYIAEQKKIFKGT